MFQGQQLILERPTSHTQRGGLLTRRQGFNSQPEVVGIPSQPLERHWAWKWFKLRQLVTMARRDDLHVSFVVLVCLSNFHFPLVMASTISAFTNNGVAPRRYVFR